MIDIDQKMPKDIVLEVAQRVKKRRKELGFTQAQVAERAGMSLASYKRFEQKGLIAFQSLVAVSFVFRCSDDFDELFAKRGYRSIDEVIAERKAQRRVFSNLAHRR